MEWIMVALGGGIGATLRYTVIKLSAKLRNPDYYATAIVNLVGSFLLGVVLQNLDEGMFLSFLAIGILGAFTTFSTFAFDLVKLFQHKHIKKLITYSVVNLAGGLLLFAVGFNL